MQYDAKPSVILWYKLYLGLLLLMFLGVAALGAVITFGDLIPAEELDGMPPAILGGIYLAMGLVFAIPCVVGFCLGRGKGAWVFHLVMICIGMTGCTLVFSIPLLIFWIKPETKAFYFDTPEVI